MPASKALEELFIILTASFGFDYQIECFVPEAKRQYGYFCLPAMAGLGLGQWVRQRIDQALFRKALLFMLFVIGLNLLRRAVF